MKESAMRKISGLLLALVLAACLPVAASAQADKEPLPPDPATDPMLLAAGYLQSHPDLAYRKYGLDAMKRKNYVKAVSHFRRAGYYADKPSQAMVAELLWTGTDGVERDRAAAYAWMDLAAEREYRIFVLQRERYWLELDEAERVRALELGQELYARYGDDQAKPRLELALRWELKKATGSRLGGFAGSSVKIGKPDDEGNMDSSVDSSKFYDARFWRADKYWAYTDALWNNLGKQAKVTVGDLQKVSEMQFEEAKSSVPPESESKDKQDASGKPY